MAWGILARLAGWVVGGGGERIADRLLDAYERKLAAETDEERISAERDLARLEAAQEAMASAERDRWSATSLGRYLIVVPFGLWWLAIMVDSILAIDGWTVLALPPLVMGMAELLIPAIIIGDVVGLGVRRLARR
jgi:hypothetical protein